MMKMNLKTLLICAALAAAAPLVSFEQTASAAPKMPIYSFENFTTANGLPDNHVYSVLVDDERIWAGARVGGPNPGRIGRRCG